MMQMPRLREVSCCLCGEEFAVQEDFLQGDELFCIECWKIIKSNDEHRFYSRFPVKKVEKVG